MSDDARVRPERDGDAAAIAAVVRDAFGQKGESRLVGALREAGALAVSLVAVDGVDAMVGHVALSPVTVGGDDGGGRWLGLAPLAVRPVRRRRGIGAALVRAALAEADARGAGLIVLLGEPGYYGRFGFETAGRHGLTLPWEVPEEAFMARPGADAGAPSAGVVRYHPAFDALV